MSKRKRSKPRHTPLSKHKKRGSKLQAPLSELPMGVIDWDRDLLPEHLWIAALARDHGIDSFHLPYRAFLDAIDEHWPDGETAVCIGLISDFGLLEEHKREAFRSAHGDLARELFDGPVGPALRLYPGCPARWLLDEALPSDRDTGIEFIRSLVSDLLTGRTELATRVRVVTFSRQLQRGRIYFQKGISEMPELLPRYPHDLDADGRAKAESFVRATMGSILATLEHLGDHDWPKHFWRENRSLAACQPIDRSPPPDTRLTDTEAIDALQTAMQNLATELRDYMALLARDVPIDVYEPRRDEILFGLFSRATRLLLLLLEEPVLWARDMGSILLRCLADTAITFVYLASKGSGEDFKKFFDYGEGQQKLLLLHLQDNHPDDTSLEGLTADDLEVGFTVMTGLIDIELGHWAGKDARKIAAEAGLERYYRLVFTPSSSDVHGTWLALKNTHLTYCEEPLHRYHRLPHLAEPPFFVSVAETARELFEECRAIGVAELGYPVAERSPSFLNTVQSPEASSCDGC